jgi:hypothetical protein
MGHYCKEHLGEGVAQHMDPACLVEKVPEKELAQNCMGAVCPNLAEFQTTGHANENVSS